MNAKQSKAKQSKAQHSTAHNEEKPTLLYTDNPVKRVEIAIMFRGGN